MNLHPPERSTRVRPFVPCLALTVLTSISLAPGATPSGWPQFRGPESNGISAERAVLSDIGSFGLEIAWKRTIGSGYSGVSVAEGHVVTIFSDGKSDFIAAFDENSGEERWRFEIDEIYKGHDGSHNGPISTPVIGGGQVFGLSPRGRMISVRLSSGELIWSTHLVEDHEATKPHYGFATSPILLDGVLVVELGKEDAAIAGFDPGTGELLWTAGSDDIAFQSPMIYEHDGRRQVLAAGMKQLFAIDPTTGEILWQYAHEGGGGRGAASMTPVPAGEGRIFLANKDDSSELISLAQKEDATVAEKSWEGRAIRNSYNVPVYNDGGIFAFSSRFLTCVDAASGEALWRSRQPGDGFLILVDGHLVILTKQGSLHVARASSEGYQDSASLEVFTDLAWTPPSFANGHIYVRSLGELARVDIRAGAAPISIAAGSDELAGSGFARFLDEVKKAPDKKEVVDRYMASVDGFPVIEGDDRVHFIYRGEGEDLAIAGDMIGARQEKPMDRIDGTDFFYYSASLEPDARVNYLFIRDYTVVTDPLNPRTTATTILNEEMEMSMSGEELEMSWIAMPDWTAPSHLKDPGETGRGRIDSREIASEVFEDDAKIKIDVYLPAGYDEDDERYEVAFVHGGGAARERGHFSTMLDNVIGESVEPVIVVFIDAGAGGGDAEKYAQMFAEELVPYVDENFRTVPSAEARANVGMGFPGFAAFYCTFRNPGVVAKVGTQSAFMLDSMQTGLLSLVKTADEQPLQVYMEWGKYDLRNPHEAWDMGASNRTFAEILEDKGYRVSGGEVHDGTGWSSWQNRTDVLFETLFPLEVEEATN